MDGDNVVFTEGVNEWEGSARRGEPTDPITIFRCKSGKYYACGGRHRTYMVYHRLGEKMIEAEVLKGFRLDARDRYHLRHGCVTIHDLVEESLSKEKIT